MILVCAATFAEVRACRRGADDAGARDVEVLPTGVGLARAGEALARRLRGGPRPDLVVSSGFVGALTPDVPLLEWVTAAAIHRAAAGATPSVVALPPGILRVAPGALRCQLVSAEELGSGTPRGLAGPVVADMESAALAEAAAAAGVPFTVLRLVTDTPSAPLPRVARSLTALLASERAMDVGRHAAGAATHALRDPLGAAEFVRASLGWCGRLRDGWRHHAADVRGALGGGAR